MNPRIHVLLMLLCFTLATCTPSIVSLRHSPKLATEHGMKFAHAAFINKDFDNAYALMSENGKAQGSPEQFRALITQKHPSTFPLSLKVTDYQPVPGQASMIIYAEGENGTDKFYYKLIMEGTEEKGYNVSAFNSSINTPFPKSELAQPFYP